MNIEKAEMINKQAGYEKVKVNDSGELVDDRQLLNAGLNVVKKKTTAVANTNKSVEKPRASGSSQTHRSNDRRRQTQLIEQQLIAQEKRKRDEEEESRARIIAQTKSRKTDDAISSARARYLARKKQAKESN